VQALFLECADTVEPVLATTGIERVTIWENVCRDRTDLPRVLDEFSILRVYEVSDAFTPPDDGHYFRPYPRPGQGALTGKPTIGLSLVLISPKHDDGAQALRDWGDFVHIRHIAQAAVPGFTMITPYENVRGDDPRYMHFYEMDTDDPEAAFQLMPKMVEARLTPEEYKAWAWHPELRIMYVNSFRLVQEGSV
jgi:hypothetical protein